MNDTTDPYEAADQEARRVGISDAAWKMVTEVGRFSKKEHCPMTKKEIGAAMLRIHGHTASIDHHLRKCIKDGLVVKVGISLSGGATYGLTENGTRLVGFQCPAYTAEGPLKD